MHFRRSACLFVLLAALAVPADALGADAVRTFSVSGRLVAASGHPSTLSLHCPESAVALNGAVTRKGSGVVVRRSSPGKESGNWAFRVAAAGSGSRSVSAVLRCVALRLPSGFSSARLNVTSRSRSIVDLAPGEARSTVLGCGRSWTATGYGLNAGADGEVRLADVIPDAHGWRFTLENTGESTQRAGVSVRCVHSGVTARGPNGRTATLRFGVTRPSRTNRLGPGRTTFTHSCGTRRFSLATGSSVD